MSYKQELQANNVDLQTVLSKVSALPEALDTSDATASTGEILSGETAYVNGAKVTGTMPNNGAVSQAINAGGSYTIPAGYHNGSGKVTGNSLASQTSANAAAGDILSGKTAWVNGTKITGSLVAPFSDYSFVGNGSNTMNYNAPNISQISYWGKDTIKGLTLMDGDLLIPDNHHSLGIVKNNYIYFIGFNPSDGWGNDALPTGTNFKVFRK